jgi:glycosyltransferase involved in cell wall biosynthesis
MQIETRTGLKPKIVLFSDSTEYGGAEKYFGDLCFSLQESKEFDVRVVITPKQLSSPLGQNLQKSKVRFDCLNTSCLKPRLFKTVNQTLNYLFSIKPDLIHFNLHHADSCRYPILIAALLSHSFIMTEHLLGKGWSLAARMTKRFKEFAYSKAKAGIVISEKNKQILLEEANIDSNKVSVVRNAINIRTLASVFSDAKQIRSKLEIDEHTLVIVTVARLEKQKGHAYLIKSLKDVVKIYPNIKLVLVGDGSLKEKLIQQINDQQLNDYCLVLGSRTDIPDLLAMADIFVLPSLSEGLPFSILEAMAMKKPVIATDVGGISEVVHDHQTGSLVASKNSRALTKAIIELLGNPNRRLELGNAGYNLVVDKFNLERLIHDTINVYKRSLAD